MPIYEYTCTECGELTEARQSFTDPPLTACPHCGGSLRKLYSPVGIVFKGSGFYSTDGKKKSASSTNSGSDTKSSTPEKTETKSEPKPSEPKKSEPKPDSSSTSKTEKSA